MDTFFPLQNETYVFEEEDSTMNWKYQVLKIVQKEWKDGFVSGLCLGGGLATFLLSRKRMDKH